MSEVKPEDHEQSLAKSEGQSSLETSEHHQDLSRRIKKEKFLIFRVEDRYFGIKLGSIKEVLEKPKITPLPEVDDYVDGIINVRGSVITVVDLKKCLSIHNSKSKRPCVLIAEYKGRYIGNIVDEILQVEGYEPKQIQKQTNHNSKISKDYIYGIVKSESKKGKLTDQLVLLLDIDKVYDARGLNLNELDQATAEVAAA